MQRCYPTYKLIAPIFLDQQNYLSEREDAPEGLRSIPGHFRLNRKQALHKIDQLFDYGVRSIMLYPLLDHAQISTHSDLTDAVSPEFFLFSFIRLLKSRFPEINLILDLCLCHFNDDGQCGITLESVLDNDLTLVTLRHLSVGYAQAGADCLMISGMIDGAVGTVRQYLDQHGFTRTILMVQSAKFDSALYGPFQRLKRQPVWQQLKSTHQIDPANRHQALHEFSLDVEEGADIIVIKPLLDSLELIPALISQYETPLFAYMTGGEYALFLETLPHQAEQRLALMNTCLLNLERSGISAVFCYFAEEYAQLLNHDMRQTSGPDAP